MAVSSPSARGPAGAVWPALPFMEWRDTLATLHRYTQGVGKVRLALAPMMNHEAAANLGRWDRARLERPFLAHPPRQPELRTEVLPELLSAP